MHNVGLLTLRKSIQGFRHRVLEETSPHLLLGAQGHQLDTEQDELPYWPSGYFSGNCQHTNTRRVRACRTPRQPLQNHLLGNIRGWAMLWSQGKCWKDNVKKWMSLSMPESLTMASRRKKLTNKNGKKISFESLVMSTPHPPLPSTLLPPPFSNDQIDEGTELN